MEHMERIIKEPTYPIFYRTIERSRSKILNMGYQVVIFKSKLRKRIHLFKHLLTVFNTLNIKL